MNSITPEIIISLIKRVLDLNSTQAEKLLGDLREDLTPEQLTELLYQHGFYGFDP